MSNLFRHLTEWYHAVQAAIHDVHYVPPPPHTHTHTFKTLLGSSSRVRAPISIFNSGMLKKY